MRRKGNLFVGFTAAVSHAAKKAMRRKIRSLNIRNRTDLTLNAIAKLLNPIIIGWINYYGKFCRSMMRGVYRHINHTLKSWAMAKYKKLRYKARANQWVMQIAERESKLFAHWREDMMGRFA